MPNHKTTINILIFNILTFFSRPYLNQNDILEKLFCRCVLLTAIPKISIKWLRVCFFMGYREFGVWWKMVCGDTDHGEDSILII